MGDVDLKAKFRKQVVVSGSSGFVGTTSTTATAIPNLIVPITSSGGPIVIRLEAAPGSSDSRISISTPNSTRLVHFQLRKNGDIFSTQTIGQFVAGSTAFGGIIVPAAMTFTDTSPLVGANMYQLFYYSTNSFDTSVGIKDAVLVAYEL